MIVDRIEEQERYYPLHPDMELAFAFLAEAPDLEPGRYELEDGLFATVSEGDTRQMDTVVMEAHKNYIDLQYCISGGERMSWAHIQELNPSTADPEHDNYFYTGNSTSVSIRPGIFYVPQRRSQGRLPSRISEALPQGSRQNSGRSPEERLIQGPQVCGFF